jgi:hypothetical protein
MSLNHGINGLCDAVPLKRSSRAREVVSSRLLATGTAKIR